MSNEVQCTVFIYDVRYMANGVNFITKKHAKT